MGGHEWQDETASDSSSVTSNRNRFSYRTRFTVLASVWWKMSFCPLIFS